MTQTIPNTENVTVAEIAAALALILASNEMQYTGASKPTLDELIEIYKKTIQAVHDAHVSE